MTMNAFGYVIILTVLQLRGKTLHIIIYAFIAVISFVVTWCACYFGMYFIARFNTVHVPNIVLQ